MQREELITLWHMRIGIFMRAFLAAALLATCNVALAVPMAQEGHSSTASFLERCELAALGQSAIGDLGYCAGHTGAVFELLDLRGAI